MKVEIRDQNQLTVSCRFAPSENLDDSVDINRGW